MSKWNQGEVNQLASSIRMASPDPEIRDAAKFGYLYLRPIIALIFASPFIYFVLVQGGHDARVLAGCAIVGVGFLALVYLVGWLFRNQKVIFLALLGGAACVYYMGLWPVVGWDALYAVHWTVTMMFK
jgi:hypothetical protein